MGQGKSLESYGEEASHSVRSGARQPREEGKDSCSVPGWPDPLSPAHLHIVSGTTFYFSVLYFCVSVCLFLLGCVPSRSLCLVTEVPVQPLLVISLANLVTLLWE